MLIIGCDYHPSMQQIAFVDTDTGERGERRLMHRDGEAERFYRELKQKEVEVRVGMEATGYARWFERLLAELGFELWIGDPARIRARRVRKQKTDRQDATGMHGVAILYASRALGSRMRSRDGLANPSLTTQPVWGKLCQ
jgi:transposase